MKRILRVPLCMMLFVIFMGTITSFAGEWRTDDKGWWYVKDNGSYAAQEWIMDNGKFYYLNQDGYMLSNSWINDYYVGTDGAMLVDAVTPDGYYVDGNGKWVEGWQPVSQNNPYAEAYAQFLTAYMTTKEYDKNYSRFQLLYIDNDDIPELAITSSSSHVASVSLYGYDHGNVVYIGDFSEFGNFMYSERGSIIKSNNFFNGHYDAQEYYLFQNNAAGTLVKRFYYDFSFVNGRPNDLYYIDSVLVTKDVFDSQKASFEAAYAINRNCGHAYGHALNDENINNMLKDIHTVVSRIEPLNSESNNTKNKSKSKKK